MVPRRLLATLSLAVTACQCFATETFGAFLRLREGLDAHQLKPRQTSSASNSSGSGTNVPLSDFPPQCQEGCATAVNGVNTCVSAFCLCTPAIDNSLEYCLQCSVNIAPVPSVIHDAQNLTNLYDSLCSGFGLTSLSISVPPGASETSPADSTTDPVAVGFQSVTILGNGIGPTTTVNEGGNTAKGGASSTGSANQPSGTRNAVLTPHSGIVRFPTMGFIVMLCYSFLI